MSSAVAGVLDNQGGLRVVVTEYWRMGEHLGPGERIFIVPGLEVQEPVAWGDATAALIAKVEAYVKSQMGKNP